MKNEEKEKKQSVEKAVRKEEPEERKRKEEAEIKKKQEESEVLRLIWSPKDPKTTGQVDTQVVQNQIDQEQGQSDPDPSEPAASFGSILEKASFSEINLIPFMPTKGEEFLILVPFFMIKKRKELLKELRRRSILEDNQGKW